MTKLNFVLCLTLLCGMGASVSVPGAPKQITDEAKLTELRHNITTHLSKLGAQANGAQLEFVKLHTATSKVVAGILYELFAEINENNKHVNCTISLWEKPWENFVKFDIECGEEKRKYQWSSEQESSTDLPPPPPGFGVFGGFSPLSEKSLQDMHPRLTSSFNEWGKDHEEFDLIVKRVISGKSQVVAGTRYVLTIEAANPKDEIKTCEADIWEKSWENFFQVKLTCDNQKNYQLLTKVPA